jgi:predicted nucleic acid-binding protein
MAGAERAFEALETSRAIVPAIWPAEVANALALGERRKRITDSDIEWFIGKLQTLTIDIDVEGTIAALDRALPLARTLGLSAYDALYLELAQRLSVPLATLDKKLAAAAKKISVELMLD